MNEITSLSYKRNYQKQWVDCPYCDYRVKEKGSLTVHLANRHNNGVKWHECPYCNFKTKWRSSLTRHLASKHGRVGKARNGK